MKEIRPERVGWCGQVMERGGQERETERKKEVIESG